MNKMKRRKVMLYFIAVLLLIVLSNFPPIRTLFGFFTDASYYRYSNGSGTWTGVDDPWKGRFYDMSGVVPEHCQEKANNYNDTIVYRCFKRNPLAFWRLREYFFDDRYKLPYRSWKEIKKKRGYDLQYANECQMF